MSSRSPRSPKKTAAVPPRAPDRLFHVESLGCAKNQVDSEIMIAALEKAGWSLADEPESAEVLIVNTCGFIAAAKKESIETSLALKSRYPGKKVIMVGCLSERYGEELARELPELDGLLGNKDPGAIVRLVEGGSGTPPRAESPAAARPFGLRDERVLPFERSHLLSWPGSAYVKIAEGCANRCTYCAIPLIRGDLASRDVESIVSEIRQLRERGVRELVLIAQDLGSYGRERGSVELPGLLTAIGSLPGEFWVRMLYIHPDHFPREILDIVAADPRFLPYFDLPFQHAAPRILRAMGRRGEAERNLELIAEIRSRLPGAVIRSTFLVGFPGETDDDFGKLRDFQEKARLDWMGAFTYSREEDTPAYAMTGRVAKKTAQARKDLLERSQVPITERALDGQVGRVLDVLVEEEMEGEDLSLGRTYLQAPEVDGLVVVRRRLPAGSIARVRLTRRNGVDLEGEVVPGARPAAEGPAHG